MQVGLCSTRSTRLTRSILCNVIHQGSEVKDIFKEGREERRVAYVGTWPVDGGRVTGETAPSNCGSRAPEHLMFCIRWCLCIGHWQ